MITFQVFKISRKRISMKHLNRNVKNLQLIVGRSSNYSLDVESRRLVDYKALLNDLLLLAINAKQVQQFVENKIQIHP